MGVHIGDVDNIDKKLNHDIDFIIKQNEFSAEHKIKNEIRQLFFKYQNGNHIHEHRKQ